MAGIMGHPTYYNRLHDAPSGMPTALLWACLAVWAWYHPVSDLGDIGLGALIDVPMWPFIYFLGPEITMLLCFVAGGYFADRQKLKKHYFHDRPMKHLPPHLVRHRLPKLMKRQTRRQVRR